MNFLLNLIKRIRRYPGKDRERGAITIAETLIALGVGATVLAVVFAAVPALIASRNANNALNGLAQAATSVRMTFGPRNNYTGLTDDLASSLAGFPRQFISGSNLRHPWGGAIAFAPVTDNIQRFAITFKDMPSDACATLVMSTMDLATLITVGTTTVNNLAVDDFSTQDVDEGTAANIAGLCVANVDVEWVFTT